MFTRDCSTVLGTYMNWVEVKIALPRQYAKKKNAQAKKQDNHFFLEDLKEGEKLHALVLLWHNVTTI